MNKNEWNEVEVKAIAMRSDAKQTVNAPAISRLWFNFK